MLRHVEDQGAGEIVILNGSDSSDSGWGAVADSFEGGIDPSGYIKGGEIVDYLNDYWPFKNSNIWIFWGLITFDFRISISLCYNVINIIIKCSFIKHNAIAGHHDSLSSARHHHRHRPVSTQKLHFHVNKVTC